MYCQKHLRWEGDTGKRLKCPQSFICIRRRLISRWSTLWVWQMIRFPKLNGWWWRRPGFSIRKTKTWKLLKTGKQKSGSIWISKEWGWQSPLFRNAWITVIRWLTCRLLLNPSKTNNTKAGNYLPMEWLLLRWPKRGLTGYWWNIWLLRITLQSIRGDWNSIWISDGSMRFVPLFRSMAPGYGQNGSITVIPIMKKAPKIRPKLLMWGFMKPLCGKIIQKEWRRLSGWPTIFPISGLWWHCLLRCCGKRPTGAVSEMIRSQLVISRKKTGRYILSIRLKKRMLSLPLSCGQSTRKTESGNPCLRHSVWICIWRRKLKTT